MNGPELVVFKISRAGRGCHCKTVNRRSVFINAGKKFQVKTKIRRRFSEAQTVGQHVDGADKVSYKTKIGKNPLRYKRNFIVNVGINIYDAAFCKMKFLKMLKNEKIS